MKKRNIYDIKELGFIPPKFGGVSVSIARLIDRLSEDGFLVGGFYTSENHDPSILQSTLFDPELNLSIKRIVVDFPRILKILTPYRVLHSHYSLEHMVYIWLFLRILKKKVVVTVHNSMVQSFYSKCSPINRYFLKKVAKHRNVVWVAVSEQAKEEMLKLPVSFRNDVQVIPAYIPDGRTTLEPLPMGLNEYIDFHKTTIVFYGHSFMLHEGTDVYGFHDALALFAALLNNTEQSIGFVLCLTECKDVYKIGQLRRIANDLGIDDKIYWQLGPLENMKSLWNKADVYIRPTCTDGDSVAIREALDLGAQVVASDVCPRPEKTILYHYGDNDDLLEKVKVAIEKGHTVASPDYSNYTKLKSVYTQLLNS